MTKPFWRIHLSKEAHKFSCTHLTIFPDGTRERLHGHNYRLSLRLDLLDASFENTLPFSQIKTLIRALCDELDERILLAAENPFIKIKKNDYEVEAIVCGARYVFPADEVVLLNKKNVTVELLAQELSERLISKLDSQENLSAQHRSLISGMEIGIQETDGQSASYVVSFI